MKLATKLVALVVLVITIALIADSYLLVERERDLLESDARQDAFFLGRVLRTVLVTAARSGSEAEVQALMDGLNRADHLTVRWLGVKDAASLNHQFGLDSDQTGELTESGVVSFKDASGDHQITLIRVALGDGATGTAEINESLSHLTATGQRFRVRVLTLTGIMLLVSVLLAAVLGTVLLGRPLAELTRHARRIGRGDLSARLELGRSDELGELAAAMNQMSADLAGARERVQQETAARMQALRQLRHDDRLRTVGRLAAGIAHELGTPLNVVSGRAAMIGSGQLSDEETVKSAEIIRNQTTRMTGIIRQLLDFARRRPLKKSPVKMRDLARQALDLLEPIARKSGVLLTLEEDDTRALAFADAGQIQQVLTNLVVNAIQAMPQGGPVDLSVRPVDAPPPGEESPRACIHIRIQDRGSGISEEDIPHLFEPFFTTKDIGKGSGLGLSIVHGIVKEHGGWIEVESQPGAGSTFSVFLPREEVDSEEPSPGG